MKPTKGLLGLLGIEIISVSEDLFAATWVVEQRHLASDGFAHHGIHGAVHETAASFAGQFWLGERGVVVGVSNSTDVFGPVRLGVRLSCSAEPVFRGDRSQVWDMESVSSSGQLIASGRVRLQHLDRPPPENYLALMSGHDA